MVGKVRSERTIWLEHRHLVSINWGVAVVCVTEGQRSSLHVEAQSQFVRRNTLISSWRDGHI